MIQHDATGRITGEIASEMNCGRKSGSEQAPFPTLLVSYLYERQANDALAAICTPLAAAKAGDVPALQIEFRHQDILMAYPSVKLIMMGPAGPESVSFTKAPAPTRDRLAAHILDCESSLD